MKRKILVLSLPLLILLGTVTTVVGLERQRTPDWQVALHQYLAHKYAVPAAVRVQDFTHARLPWNFREQMGTASRNPNDWQWSIDLLPYPPDYLSCVLIDRTPSASIDRAAEPARQVLYVAHHSDKLWRVGWIVHEGPTEPFPPELASDLSTLGCDLEPFVNKTVTAERATK